MTRFLPLALLCSLAYVSLQSQSFTGQVFLLAENYQPETCMAEAPCDCCGTELVFLSRRNFVMVAYCLPENSYFAGTYKIKDDQLSLSFQPGSLSEILEPEKNEVKWEKKKSHIEDVKFTIETCGKGMTMLSHATVPDFRYGLRRPAAEEQKILAKVKGLSIDKQLKSK